MQLTIKETLYVGNKMHDVWVGCPKISNIRNSYVALQIHIHYEKEMLKSTKIFEIRPYLRGPIERQSFST